MRIFDVFEVGEENLQVFIDLLIGGCRHFARSPLVNMIFLPMSAFFNSGQWYFNPK